MNYSFMIIAATTNNSQHTIAQTLSKGSEIRRKGQSHAIEKQNTNSHIQQLNLRIYVICSPRVQPYIRDNRNNEQKFVIIVQVRFNILSTYVCERTERHRSNLNTGHESF